MHDIFVTKEVEEREYTFSVRHIATKETLSGCFDNVVFCSLSPWYVIHQEDKSARAG